MFSPHLYAESISADRAVGPGVITVEDGFQSADLVARQYGTTVWHYPSPDRVKVDTPVDLFCVGHAVLADGRLLAAGGT